MPESLAQPVRPVAPPVIDNQQDAAHQPADGIAERYRIDGIRDVRYGKQ